ncbi:MAG: lytic murein transglycosylase [Sulfurimonas sp.]|jgi:membrane-bound lytic murein transglycosylase B|nr:lytic murein transglycosylase [Sulfurimonadaceae bacterium]
MKKLILFLLITSALQANCEKPLYKDICQRAQKSGVKLEYIESFLASSKTKTFDEKSFKLMQPSQISSHKKSEKKANNTLLEFVPNIVKHLDEYKEVYDRVERDFGVNREIVAAILAKETRLGLIKPPHDAFVVFHTLLSRTKPQTSREKWLVNMSKANIVSILKYCYESDIKPDSCNLPSSYAGAIGISQFMPDNLNLALSYTKGAADITKMEDAILSSANFLHQKASFNTLAKWSEMGDVAKIESEWYEFEFKHQNASFVYSKNREGKAVYNCFACGKKELEYIKEQTKKIMSYNNSSNYAIGVLRLAYEAYRSR